MPLTTHAYRLLAVWAFAATLLVSAPARAQSDEQLVVGGTVATLGVVLGLTNSIGTIVYAVRDRSFDDGWMVSACVGAAINLSTGIYLTVESSETDTSGLMLPALIAYAIALWPAGWAVHSALSDADLGEPLDPVRRMEERQRKAREAEIEVTATQMRVAADPFAPGRAPNALPMTFTLFAVEL